MAKEELINKSNRTPRFKTQGYHRCQSAVARRLHAEVRSVPHLLRERARRASCGVTKSSW